jgi:hypothetical protein
LPSAIYLILSEVEGRTKPPDYLAFLFSLSIRSLAAGPDEAGFWPVISWPSTTV